MVLTTHAIAGAAVASFFPTHPVVAFSVAFASHFLLDAIPHSRYEFLSSSMDPHSGKKMIFDKPFFLDVLRVGTDAILGIALALLLFSTMHNFWIILGGAVFGIFPDFLQFVYARFPREPLIALEKFHIWVHTRKDFKSNSVFGVVSQIAIVLIIIFLTKSFH